MKNKISKIITEEQFDNILKEMTRSIEVDLAFLREKLWDMFDALLANEEAK